MIEYDYYNDDDNYFQRIYVYVTVHNFCITGTDDRDNVG